MDTEKTPHEAAKPPKWLRPAVIVAACAGVAIIVFGTVSRAHDVEEAETWSDARSIPTVRLVSAEANAPSTLLTLPGTMEAFNSAKIYARVGGYLKSWDRDIGAQVKAGTPLGLIDTPELDQQIVQARADLTSAEANQSLARSTAKRWDDLVASASVSKQEAEEKDGDLLAKTAAVKAAQANLARLLAMKSFSTLVAPFSGIVTARNADIGDLVNAGQGSVERPLFEVADVHQIRIYVSVPQSYSAALAHGLVAHLSVPDYPGRSFTATVIGTSGAINTQSGTLLVQLIADNADGALKPGGYAQVSFGVPAKPGVVQIASSTLIFRKQGMQVAMIGPGDRVHLQPITIGRDLGATVEVTSGLKPSDKVIDNPPDSLAQDEQVRLAEGSHG
jgi:RND family efflux transporter MFP subunit